MPTSLLRAAAWPSPAAALATILAVALAGCSGGDGGAPRDFGRTDLRIVGSGSADGDATAAALLLSLGIVPAHASAPRPPLPLDATLTSRLSQMVLDHLWTSSLGTADGPAIVSSARIRRIAAEAGAPADSNGNGTNLDEVLAAEIDALAALAGSPAPGGVTPLLAIRRGAGARLRSGAFPRSRAALDTFRTVEHQGRELTAIQLGHGLLARTWTGAALGQGRRGSLVGATSQRGTLAFLALQQALSVDESLLNDLSFDGLSLGSIEDPRSYDPANGPRWIPASVAYLPSTALPGAPSEWLVVDRASDLRGLAVLLRAAAELAWLTDPDNPTPELRELFVGTPLEPPAGSGGPGDVTTWADDVRPILHGPAGCVGCHAPPFPASGYSVASYDDALLAGASGVPAVTPTDHGSSPLWLLVNGPWTPPNRGVPISRMPLGGAPLPQQEIDTIARWIDEGALRETPPPPPGPRPGLDLARVLFRNVVALHAVADGPGAGLLDRRSGSQRSGLVGAAETGLLLRAVAALHSVDGEEPGVLQSLQSWAQNAAEHLADADGDVVAEWDLRSGAATGMVADLATRAALGAGLLAAARVTGDGDLRGRGLAIAGGLLRDSWDRDSGLFDVRPGDPSRQLRPADLAAVLELLQELRLAGDPAGLEVCERLLSTLSRVLAFSELDGMGEILGDGIPDTDRNGVVEAGEAGLAPVFADLVREGPDPDPDLDSPITWSRHLLPLFRSRCTGCHTDGAHLGGYRLDTAELAARAGDSGTTTMVVPGDPERSFLYRKLQDRPPALGAQMPLDRPPLAAHERELVRRWILEGARDR